MPTKYDVFAEVVEKAPCKQKDLDFKKSIYAQVNSLVRTGWIKKDSQGILNPIKNDETEKIFRILKWSLKNNVNYNPFFSKNMKQILLVLSKTLPKLNPKKLAGNKKNNEIIDFLEKHQFILSWKRSPKLGVLLNHKILNLILGEEIKEKYLSSKEITNKVKNISKKEINPFDRKIFEFLAGSAQLEGSTVSIGETVELILNAVYPDKPAKDIQMVKNLNEAMKYILEHLKEDLTLDSLKEINRVCLFSLDNRAGQFKKVQNKVLGNTNFKTISPEKVEEELEKFCREFNSIKSREECLEKIGFIHNQHQRIHPFADGNSRTTRLLVNWLLMKFNFPLLILKTGAFERYMDLTKLSKKRDDSFLRDFMLHVIYHEEVLKD
ncbi:Fic family protein [Candidatus Woesearchaeota archaeon]|nr:Fic family protein [Candidatus Woesearchaeota archaeon]